MPTPAARSEPTQHQQTKIFSVRSTQYACRLFLPKNNRKNNRAHPYLRPVQLPVPTSIHLIIIQSTSLSIPRNSSRLSRLGAWAKGVVRAWTSSRLKGRGRARGCRGCILRYSHLRSRLLQGACPIRSAGRGGSEGATPAAASPRNAAAPYNRLKN